MYKVTKPTLLLDKKKAIDNITRMAKKAKSSGVIYRPHFKTHFSKEIGEWYRDLGVKCITVSSIDMAVYFASHGWADITIAFPVNVRQIDVLSHLAKQVNLGLVVESVAGMDKINEKISNPVDIYIKIDTGYRRTGMWHEQVDEIKALIQGINEPHRLKGLLAHFGHTYHAKDTNEVKSIYNTGIERLTNLREQLGGKMMISIGDTPSCSLVDEFGAVDEIRPGNLIFYDVMQAEIGSCKYDNIAVCMAAPVVAIYPERSEVVLHGGAVHLSKDFLMDENNTPYYGSVVSLQEKGWSAPIKGAKVISLSQEHGKVSLPEKEIKNLNIGDLLGILPVHSCLTANLMKEYMTLRGEKISTIHTTGA